MKLWTFYPIFLSLWRRALLHSAVKCHLPMLYEPYVICSRITGMVNEFTKENEIFHYFHQLWALFTSHLLRFLPGTWKLKLSNRSFDFVSIFFVWKPFNPSYSKTKIGENKSLFRVRLVQQNTMSSYGICPNGISLRFLASDWSLATVYMIT